MVWRCLSDPAFSRFGTVPVYGRQTDRLTDGRTDGHTTTAYRPTALAYPSLKLSLTPSHSHSHTHHIEVTYFMLCYLLRKQQILRKNKHTCNSNIIKTTQYAKLKKTILHCQQIQMYSESSRFHPNRFTFGVVIAERVNTTKSRPKK